MRTVAFPDDTQEDMRSIDLADLAFSQFLGRTAHFLLEGLDLRAGSSQIMPGPYAHTVSLHSGCCLGFRLRRISLHCLN